MTKGNTTTKSIERVNTLTMRLNHLKTLRNAGSEIAKVEKELIELVGIERFEKYYR